MGFRLARGQSWLELAFIHYLGGVAAGVRRFGVGGLVPFRIARVTKRGLPDLPDLSTFPELNLRTYVGPNGKPDLWFVSLDAASPARACGVVERTAAAAVARKRTAGLSKDCSSPRQLGHL